MTLRSMIVTFTCTLCMSERRYRAVESPAIPPPSMMMCSPLASLEPNLTMVDVLVLFLWRDDVSADDDTD